MSNKANFKVDPKLASLLGENYRSTELALKELVDNAWDADADEIRITLSQPLSGDPIIIEDNGFGMTEADVREDYLKVASDRRTRKGDRTQMHKRPVKGRKGIGKFAGLMIADVMEIETTAKGFTTRVTVSKADIERATTLDLETIELPLSVSPAPTEDHRTRVTLRFPNQRFELPKADKLKELLVLEYGRESNLVITVDAQPLKVEDLSGEHISEVKTTTNGNSVRIDFKVSEGNKPLPRAGIAVRINGKIVGKPSFFGLENDEDIPPKLLRRVWGEIQADHLADSTTADWGDLVESSPRYQEVQAIVQARVKEAIAQTYSREMSLQQARLKQALDRRLAELPENRRHYAELALNKVLARFYDESEEKRTVIASVVLDAFEHDEYWVVLKHIDESSSSDIHSLADALSEFGLVDAARLVRQAQSRIKLLDYFETMIRNPETQEMDVHKVVEKNLWILGPEYSLVRSNQTLASALGKYLDKEYQGARAKKRPDLFLGRSKYGKHLLIEFKKPSIPITRDHEAQAAKYRDDLTRTYGEIDLLLLGKERSRSMSIQNDYPNSKVFGFEKVVAEARSQLEWLLQELVISDVAPR